MQNTDKTNLTQLSQEFTFWFTFFKKSKDKQMEEFEDNLKEIASFNTAEEFWGIYQHMKRPDALPRGCEFFLFRKGIKPMWEDMANVGGGRFYLSMKKSGITNKVWEDLLIAMILIDENTIGINGVVLNVRTSEVIMSVWTTALDEDLKQKTRLWIKEALDLPNEQVVNHKLHPTNEQLLAKQKDLIKEEEERKKKLQEMEKKELERRAKEEEEMLRQEQEREALAKAEASDSEESNDDFEDTGFSG